VSATAGARVAEIAWSADGLRLAYELNAEDDSTVGTSNAGIYAVNAAGGASVLAHPSSRSRSSLAGWSGDNILFWQQEDRAAQPGDSAWLYAVSAPMEDGEAPRTPRLLTPEPMLPLRDFVAVGPASQDYPIAFVSGLGPATWTNKRLTSGAFRTPSSLAAIAPAWDPDGIRLAYIAMPDTPGISLGPAASAALEGRRLWTAAPAAGASRQLTADERFRDERPIWSQEGSHVLFARITREGQASVWVIPANGGEPQLVVDELTPAPDLIGNYGYIDWSQHFDWWRG
jgi:Tol biopolymer transport system component